MKKKNVMGRGKRTLLLFTKRVLTAAAIGFNNAVLAEASMSYLGLGIQPPEPSLGRMLSEAQSYLFNAPWYAIGPGVTIILIILGFSMVSEGLRSMQQ